ncbi:TPA: hypothetical protein ACTXXA_003659 [Legionella anisa]
MFFKSRYSEYKYTPVSTEDDQLERKDRGLMTTRKPPSVSVGNNKKSTAPLFDRVITGVISEFSHYHFIPEDISPESETLDHLLSDSDSSLSPRR